MLTTVLCEPFTTHCCRRVASPSSTRQVPRARRGPPFYSVWRRATGAAGVTCNLLVAERSRASLPWTRFSRGRRHQGQGLDRDGGILEDSACKMVHEKWCITDLPMFKLRVSTLAGTHERGGGAYVCAGRGVSAHLHPALV